ncbi:MAG: hypothetical protein KGI71_06130 [Patescibacteria group bacterium]|nr:hypothetical protein [Patescibacteria group bacterium]
MPNAMLDPNMLARGPVQAPKFLTPYDLQQMQYKSQLEQMNIQEAQRKVDAQNAMRGAFSQPGAFGPGGQISPEALQRIGQVDPMTAIDVSNKMLDRQRTEQQIKLDEQKAVAEEQKARLQRLMPLAQDTMGKWDELESGEGTMDEKIAKVTQYRNEQIDEALKSGAITAKDAEIAKAQKFNPFALRYQLKALGVAGAGAAPKTRNRIVGSQEIQEEFDPVRQKWTEIGRGPRFAKSVAPVVQVAGVNESTIPVQDREKTGEDFLKTLPKAQQAEVKALVEGRLPMSPYALRSKQMWPLVERAMQYDPTFDASNYNVRLSVRRDFASGPTSKNITAINTAIGHIGTLDELALAMNNKDVKAINRLFNRISTETGNPQVNNFNLARSAVGDELMRTFRQVGASETEANAWKQNFDSANSPAQFKGAIKVAAELLNSRINAINDTWKRGMNTDKDYGRIVSPKSKSVLKKMGIELEAGSDESGGAAKANEVPMTNAKGWTLHIDAKGRKAYVSPDGKQFEEAK